VQLTTLRDTFGSHRETIDNLKAGNMNKLSKEKQAQIISALVDGNSLRATSRMCDRAFTTILKLVPQIGAACLEYTDWSAPKSDQHEDSVPSPALLTDGCRKMLGTG
jgi:hypothetical protein